MTNIKNLIGTKVNKLTVIAQSASKNYRSNWLCKCECGKEIVLPSYTIWRGTVISCGCHNKYGGLTVKQNHIYRLWFYMKERCYNPGVLSFEYYGGRGITVCNEWIDDFPKFCSWALENGWKKGLQLDRQNNNEGYSPDNCRFTTPTINGRNKRNNKILDFMGQKKSLSEWAEIYNIKPALVSKRINANWDIERALTAPSKKAKKDNNNVTEDF